MAKDLTMSELTQTIKIISVKLNALEYEVVTISRNLNILKEKLDADPIAACKDRMVEYANKGKKSYQKVPYCDPRSDKKTTTTCPKA